LDRELHGCTPTIVEALDRHLAAHISDYIEQT
jgi:hypothetical protein